MKLFSPQDANTFVFATVAMNAREGTSPDYKCVSGPDVETCLKQIDAAKLRSAYPHAVGRYDEQGRYCTYKPPLENVQRLQHGRFCRHPSAQQEYEVHKRELMV